MMTTETRFDAQEFEVTDIRVRRWRWRWYWPAWPLIPFVGLGGAGSTMVARCPCGCLLLYVGRLEIELRAPRCVWPERWY